MDRNFNINTLVAFLTVAREGSVSRAAEVLNLTQPAVSHQIKRLNEETNSTLFERAPTGLRLTADGIALLPKAEQVLSAFSDLKRSALRNADRVRGKLKIGTIIDPEFIRLGQLLNHLRRDYPDIETELVHGVSGEIFARLQRKQIDAGFYLSGEDEVDQIADTTKGEIQARSLAKFSYRVIAPAGWEGRVENATWSELAKLPWIGTPAVSAHHRLLTPIFEAHACAQSIIALVDHEASMLEMVRSGVGLSLCRESIALHQRQSSGLTVCGSVAVPACLSLVYNNPQTDTPVQRALLDIVKQIWQGRP